MGSCQAAVYVPLSFQLVKWDVDVVGLAILRHVAYISG